MNKKYPLVLLAVAVLLTGCDSNEARAIKIVEKDVRSTLLDPDAGRFTNMRALQLGDNSNSYMVCGEVNGKNTIGAYTGATEFNAYIFDIRERDPIAVIAINKNTSSLKEHLLFERQNQACIENGVKKYLEKEAEIRKINEKKEALKTTPLGRVVFDAASDSTYVSRELGESSRIHEVYAREDDKHAFVSVTNYDTPDFYKFKKNDKGEFEPVKGLSYTGYPSAVTQCQSGQVYSETCITEEEIKLLRSEENKLDDFIVPPEE
ncbi:hypothetical protein NDG50_004255 [Salmonella enterica]|nr:hypothetical protein [Salmonella enterica]EJI3102572.1 hypothetical protein [Salmonella enterica]EJI4256286.1 hypothetical protein [Salmonella enterica]